jgi:hypothetical protein
LLSRLTLLELDALMGIFKLIREMTFIVSRHVIYRGTLPNAQAYGYWHPYDADA